MDLRCAYEKGAQATDLVIPDEALPGITIRLAPTEDHGDPEFRKACFPILDSPRALAPQLVPAAASGAGGIRSHRLGNPGRLVHCSAGRDRAGMISALLLGNACVDPVLVAQDYAASVRPMAGVGNHSPTIDEQADWSGE